MIGSATSFEVNYLRTSSQVQIAWVNVLNDEENILTFLGHTSDNFGVSIKTMLFITPGYLSPAVSA